MQKLHMQVVLVYLQFTLKMCITAKNCKKITKNLFLGNSRSLMLINLKGPSPVLVMMSSMYAPISNSFHFT